MTPKENSEIEKKITEKLWTLNQWLLPLMVTYIVAFSVWVVTGIFDLRERASLVESMERNENHAPASEIITLRSEFSAAIAKLPPEEWKKRIIATEDAIRSSAVQNARFETLLMDVRERVIRIDEQHKIRSADK